MKSLAHFIFFYNYLPKNREKEEEIKEEEKKEIYKERKERENKEEEREIKKGSSLLICKRIIL